MNHIYRLCWNRALRAWVPTSELAKNKDSRESISGTLARVPLMLSLLSVSMSVSGLAWAGNSPTGVKIASGSGQITQSGDVTTIQQSSQTLSLNWQSFDIGTSQTVDFLQPSRNSIAVNRILGNTASDIEGHLNANGQVWLINPNGVLFGKDAQVNVGGIVASTLDLNQSTLGTGSARFAGDGKGSVVNLGTIAVTPGGYAALLGNMVSNQGTIRAQLGTVALAGGTAVTLTFADNQLVHLVVNTNTVQSLVENRQLIVADGGQVLMTAGARSSLINSVVNNSGTVQAQTVQNHNGTITLLGGMEAGTVNVAGTLDASAPNGSNGGQIETSGAHFTVAGDANITAASISGKAGTWLVDPEDLTIDSAAASTIGTSLSGGTNVTEQTTATGTSGAGTVNVSGSGNINVNAAINWNSSATLTLQAYNGIDLNAAITNSGSGKTVLQVGTSGSTNSGFVNAAGASALGGNWAIYSVTPTANTLGGLAPAFIQYNATLSTTVDASGNGLFYTAKPTLTVSGLAGNVTKSYDGSTAATLAASNFTDSGLLGGDSINSAAGTYSQSDVGAGLTVTSPSSISGFDIVNGNIPVYGYALSGMGKTANIGTINAAQLYATAIGDPSKIYDGTATATLSSANYYITGLVPGQSITVNQPSSVGYASADVNTNNGTTPGGGEVAVNATFTSTNFIAGLGTKLSNYILPTATSTTGAALAQDATAGYGIIMPAPVQLSGVLATGKTYDAATNDPLDISNANIYGVVSSDSVTLDTNGAIGTFATANAGSGIAVGLSGFTLAGNATKVADYQLIVPTNLTADIYQKALTVTGVTAPDKVYDGTTTETLGTTNAMLSGFVNAADQASTTLNTSSATGTFSQSDAGNNLAVAVNGLTVNDANYTVTAPTGLIADITPRMLDIEFNGSADKIYDGTDYAALSTGNFTVGNAVPGQTVTVNQSPAVYTGTDAPNVGTDMVTATLQSSDLSFTNGAKAGNYAFNASVVGSGSITPAPLTVAIIDNPTKVYDGDASVTLGNDDFQLSGLIPGQSITVNPTFGTPTPDASYASANAGVEGVTAALMDSNYTAASGTLLTNYILPTTAIGYGTITPRELGVSIIAGITGANKTYDGTPAITLTPGNFTLTGFVSGDSATVNQDIAGTFASKNVGSQPLTATLLESNFNFTGSDEGNYTFPVTAYGAGTINPATLIVSIIGNPTKTYDGNTTVLPLTGGTVVGSSGTCPTSTCNFQITGLVNGEGATINPTASFTYATQNAGASGSDFITGALTQSNYVANSGTLLSNYTLDYMPTGFGTINKANLYVTGVYAQDKTYDNTTDALIDISNGLLAGLADVDKNASAITLNIGNSTTSTVAGVSGSTGTIAASAGGGFTGTSSPVAGAFASSSAGTGITVTTNNFYLSGSSANNYNLEPIALSANINQAPLYISGITGNNKVYDGTTAATFGTSDSYTFDTADAILSGFVGGDIASDVTLNAASATGTFSTANVGNNLAVAGVGGFSLAAGSAADKSGNYYVVNPSGLTANITPRPLSVTITGNPIKAYDGTTSATLTADDYTIGAIAGNPDSGWVSGQGATLPQSATANYVSPNVNLVDGIVSTVGVVSTLVSSDWKVDNSSTLLSNYILPTSATGLGTITPLVLDLSASRVYDTTADIYSNISGNVTNADNASVFGTLSGINGDQFVVGGQGAASSKNVGTYTGTGASDRPTSGQGFNLGTLALVASGSAGSGTDIASNYTLVGGMDTYAITKAPLTINNGTVNTKVYDGTVAANISGTSLTAGDQSGDVLAGDTVTLVTDAGGNIAGTFASKNANTGAGTTNAQTMVTYNTVDITGADSGNYQITQPSSLMGNITQRPVTISGVRQYNGADTVISNSAAITWAMTGAVAGDSSSGVVSGDTVNVNGGTGSVSSSNVGTYNTAGTGTGINGTFAATGLALSNSNYAISATGNQFQITPYQINFTGSSTYTGLTTVGVTGAGAGSFTDGDGVSSTDGTFATGVNGETLILGGIFTLPNSGNVTGNINGDGVATAVKTTGSGGLNLSSGSGTASNYTINSVNYTINPVVLSFSGSRDYNDTTSVYATAPTSGNIYNIASLVDAGIGSATFGSTTFSGLNGDQFTVSGTGTLSGVNHGAYTGTGVASAAPGSTQIGVSGLTLNATGSNSMEKATNYTLVGGSDTYAVNQLAVTPIATAANKYYDGNTTAAVTVSGLVPGDTSAVFGYGSAIFASPDVAYNASNQVISQAVTVNGITLSDPNDNYVLSTNVASTTATINPVTINFTGSSIYSGLGTVGVSDGNFSGASNTSTGGNGIIYAVDGDSIFDTGVNGETLTLEGASYTLPNSGNVTVSSGIVNAVTTGANGLSLGNGSGNAGNYVLGNVGYTINPYVLNISGTRAYNGGTIANGGDFGTLNGLGGDIFILTGQGAVYSSNAGTSSVAAGSTSAPSGSQVFGLGTLTLQGSGATASSEISNYTLVGTSTNGQPDTYTITPYLIDLSGSRQYTGGTTADADLFGNRNGTINGVDGEVLSLMGSGVVSSADANSSPYQGTGVSGNPTSGQGFNLGTLALGDNDSTLARNYTLVNGSDSLTITPYVLNLSGTRVYDANTGAAASLFGADGVLMGVNGQTMILSGTGQVGDKNVGLDKPFASLGTLSLADGSNGGLVGNYTLVGGTDTLSIIPATLTVVGTTVDTKAYDSTTEATLSGATLSGLLGSDRVTLRNDTSGTFASPNANTNIGVTAETMTTGGTDAGNYTLVQPTGLSGTITPMVLNLTGIRTYDGTTNIYSDGTSENSFNTVTGLNGDTFTLSGEGSTAGKDVNGGAAYTGTGTIGNPASGQGFNLGTLALFAAGSTGAGTDIASNYTLVGGTDLYTITPATLTVVGTTVDTKAYDSTTAATLSGATLNGLLGSDRVTLGNDTSGTFASPNVGTNIGVAPSAMTIGGTDVGDYILVQPASVTGTITPVVLDLTGTRVYNGYTNADADLFGNDGVLSGVNGETLTLGGSGMLSTKNVGTQQPFAGNGLSGFTLTGNGSALDSNYTLTGGTDWVTITPLAITVDATGKDKTYDGTSGATVTLGSSGVLAGDTVEFSDGSANFGSPNAGTDVPVSVTGIATSGADAGNYTFKTTASTSANITPYVLDLTGTRVYDTTTNAYGSNFGTVAGLDGDTFTVSGDGSVSSKNVGAYDGIGGSSFDLGNLTLVASGSALTGNYMLAGGTDIYTIAPAMLTVVGTTVGTKTYDGNITASLSGATLTGALGSDLVTLGNDTTGTFASANVGTERVATSMTIGGNDAGNYAIVQPIDLSGIINPYVLDLSSTRVYDGTTNAVASLFGNDGALTGIDGQTVILGGTGQIGDKNIGANKPFASLGTLTLSDGSNGGLGSNYTLVGGTDMLSITPKTIVVDATGTNKIYDANALDTVTLASRGGVKGDSVQLGYGAADFTDPNIGNDKVVTVTGVQLSGVDAINYLLASPTVYTQADITGAQASAFGISNGTLARVDSVLGPMELTTPYGTATQDTEGAFNGNKKRLHRSVERNASRSDFVSGLALKVVDGGVRVPVQALP